MNLPLLKLLLVESEQNREQEIEQWMQSNFIHDYEINSDGSVTINQALDINNCPEGIIGFDGSSVPFTHIRAINNNATLYFSNGCTTRLNQFINAINGYAEFQVSEGCPILSIPKIQGLKGLKVSVFDAEFDNEINTNGLDIGRKIMEVKEGRLDVLELQDALVDAGLPKMGRF